MTTSKFVILRDVRRLYREERGTDIYCISRNHVYIFDAAHAHLLKHMPSPLLISAERTEGDFEQIREVLAHNDILQRRLRPVDHKGWWDFEVYRVVPHPKVIIRPGEFLEEH